MQCRAAITRVIKYLLVRSFIKNQVSNIIDVGLNLEIKLSSIVAGEPYGFISAHSDN